MSFTKEPTNRPTTDVPSSLPRGGNPQPLARSHFFRSPGRGGDRLRVAAADDPRRGSPALSPPRRKKPVCADLVCNNRLWRSSLILAFVCCYLMWAITFLAQLHPLIEPKRSDLREKFTHE